VVNLAVFWCPTEHCYCYVINIGGGETSFGSTSTTQMARHLLRGASGVLPAAQPYCTKPLPRARHPSLLT